MENWKVLVELHFPDGTVKYLGEGFKVVIEGFVYPRQLKTASEIVDIYKQCSREDIWKQ